MIVLLSIVVVVCAENGIISEIVAGFSLVFLLIMLVIAMSVPAPKIHYNGFKTLLKKIKNNH